MCFPEIGFSACGRCTWGNGSANAAPGFSESRGRMFKRQDALFASEDARFLRASDSLFSGGMRGALEPSSFRNEGGTYGSQVEFFAEFRTFMNRDWW